MMAGPAIHFVALRTFEARVNGCVNRYREGKHYYARPGDKWDDLRSRLPRWERERRIAIGLKAAAKIIPLPIARGRATVTR